MEMKSNLRWAGKWKALISAAAYASPTYHPIGPVFGGVEADGKAPSLADFGRGCLIHVFGLSKFLGHRVGHSLFTLASNGQSLSKDNSAPSPTAIFPCWGLIMKLNSTHTNLRQAMASKDVASNACLHYT